MANPLNNEERFEVLRMLVTRIGEHFPAVQVVVERPTDDGEGTTRMECGIGSYFARFGLMRSWMIRAEETERECARYDVED